MRCGVCLGKKKIHAGGGSFVPCPACKGAGEAKLATVGDAVKRAAAVAPSTSTVLRFVVPGEPVGKERARVFRKESADGRVITRAVTPEKTRAYEEKVRTVAQIAVNQSRWAWSKDDRFNVVLKIFRTHVDAGPDVDNVIKVCADSLNGIAWKDDRYVWGIGAALQPRDPENPRVEVEVRRFKKGAA